MANNTRDKAGTAGHSDASRGGDNPATHSRPDDSVADESLFEKGLRVRREVVGEDKVDGWLDAADEFTRPLEELTTEIGWGTIWSRPGLDRRTRSLLTIVLLAAQHRDEELEVHLQNALRNGCSHEEIREALLHTMAYCGIPTSRHAVKLASRVLGRSGGRA